MELNEIKNLIRGDEEREVTELDLSYNQLTSLPPEISELKNLTKLNISFNKLTSLPPEISELKNLTELYISANQLTSLPPEISELKNLTKLHISANQLTSLPPEISELKNLTELYISENQLTSLPPEILKLGLNIKWEYQLWQDGIFLGGNPFENPPIWIIKQGREAILNYFKSLESKNKPLNEVKVLLVGEGGTGKNIRIDENGLMEVLEELLRKTQMNEIEIQKILQIIQKMETESIRHRLSVR